MGVSRLNWFVFTICLLSSAPLFALRCGHSLVQPGDYKGYVYDICGEPDYVDSHYERRGNANQANVNQFNFNGNRRNPNNSFNYGQKYYEEVEVLVEEWVYDFGSARLRKLLRFENGRLKEVENLGRKRRR
jgi:ABC-type oligopeptide transport system substrate-binding subunit